MQYKPKDTFIIKCEHCNKEFNPKTPNQKYCSIFCRIAGSKNRRKEREQKPKQKYNQCIYCGRIINKITSNKYCSEQCYKLYRNMKRKKDGINKINNIKILEPKFCLNCRKQILLNDKNKYNYKKAKFCSHKCSANYRWHNLDDAINFRKEGFQINIRKNENSKYFWQAEKNNKIVLKSIDFFNTSQEAAKDARLAFC